MYYYIVEQLFFVIFFARALAQFTTSNLVFHKLCSGDDGNHYLGKICPNDLEAQKATTLLNTWLFVTGNLSFIIACTVGGYYSDLYKKRKPLIWIPILGLTIASFVNIAFVHFWDQVSGLVVAIFNGLMCLFGETNLLYTGGTCYVSDHSPEHVRTFRIGILVAAYYISTPIGRGLAGQLNVQIGFINCYLICIALYVISFGYVFFGLTELSQVKSAYYADDKEKTTSIQRALKLYDKISISSDVKSEGVSSKDDSLQVSQLESKSQKNVPEDVQELNVDHLDRIHVAAELEEKISPGHVPIGHNAISKIFNITTELKVSENTKASSNSDINQDSTPVPVNSISHQAQTSNPEAIPTNMTFMNNSIDDSEWQHWKQTPAKKSKSKKSSPYYSAYLSGKRPPLPNENQNVPQKKSSLFLAFYSLYDSWKMLFKERAGNKTRILVIMILTSPLCVAPMIVENSVFPLFVRQKFEWTEPMYGAFAAFKLAVIVVGIIFTIGYLGKILKIQDAIIGAMASVVDTLACFGYILVTQSWQMFLVPICDMFHGSAQIAVTAVISKQVDEAERGKIFALKYTMDSLIPIVLYPLYNGVYRVTVSYFPAAFFLLSAACSLPGIFAFSYVHHLQRDRTYTLTTKL